MGGHSTYSLLQPATILHQASKHAYIRKQTTGATDLATIYLHLIRYVLSFSLEYLCVFSIGLGQKFRYKMQERLGWIFIGLIFWILDFSKLLHGFVKKDLCIFHSLQNKTKVPRFLPVFFQTTTPV